MSKLNTRVELDKLVPPGTTPKKESYPRMLQLCKLLHTPLYHTLSKQKSISDTAKAKILYSVLNDLIPQEPINIILRTQEDVQLARDNFEFCWEYDPNGEETIEYMEYLCSEEDGLPFTLTLRDKQIGFGYSNIEYKEEPLSVVVEHIRKQVEFARKAREELLNKD